MLRSFLLLFGAGGLGRLLGLLRELLLAGLFGTAGPVPPYRVGFTATFIPINFLATESLTAGFLPLYARYARERPGREHLFFWILAVLLGSLSVASTALMLLCAPALVTLLTPGLDLEVRQVAIWFARVMALGIPFYVVGNLLAFLEMAHGRYRLAAIRPSVQNLGLILGACAAFGFGRAVWLAWGFTAAYIAFSIGGGWMLRRDQLLSRPTMPPVSDVVELATRFWLTVRPLLLAPLFLQGALAVERAISSLLGVTVVAALDYAKVIAETGIALVAAPLGLSVLSTLRGMEPQEVLLQLRRLIPGLFILSIPASAFVAIEAESIVRVLYGRGQFDTSSALATHTILVGLAIGSWAQVAMYPLISGLNVMLRNREVIWCLGVGLLVQTAINISLYSVLGPLALGLAASSHAVVFLFLASRTLGLGRLVGGCIARLGLGVVFYAPLALWMHGTGPWQLLPSILLFGFFWTIFVMASPRLRSNLLPLREALSRKLR